MEKAQPVEVPDLREALRANTQAPVIDVLNLNTCAAINPTSTHSLYSCLLLEVERLGLVLKRDFLLQISAQNGDPKHNINSVFLNAPGWILLVIVNS